MSTPNEYSHTHAFHPDNVSSLVIQAAHTHANYNTAPTTSNAAAAAAHFGGGSFFPNTIGYDVTMLPFFSHGTQRPAHFNTSSPSSFNPPKHTPENQTKNEQLAQITVGNARTDSFNADAANSQAIYWSRQSQLSPFGVLPHEISPNQVTEEKSSYENALNAHFVAQSLNNLNQTQDKMTTQAIIMSKLKETNAKKPHQFAPKLMNEVKQAYSQEEVNYRNGVVNHNINHTIAKSFKGKNENETLMTNETSNTVPRDYRVFKSSEIFPTHPAAQTSAVKYVSKGSKQYPQQKQMIAAGKHSNNVTLMKTQQRSSQGLPLMQQQKIGDFHDGQSSPISLTSNDINEHHRYSSTTESMHVAASAMGNVNYRDMPDPNCHNNAVDKAKVTSSFLKLPYSVANAPSNTIADACQTNHKTPYPPLYVVYNNLIAQKRAEKQLEPSETHIPHTDTTHSNITSKSSQNSSVGYSSVIMRTDRSYETDEKEKLARRIAWPNTNDSRVKADKLNIVQTPQQQPVPANHQQLLLGLTERQHSYFDTSPCQQQMQSMSATAATTATAAAKCNPKEAPHHQQMVQSQEQMNAYQQQYNMPLNKTTMPPVNQMTTMQPETEKPFSRKRKAPPKNNAIQEYQNRDPPPAHVNVYQQPLQNSSYYDMSKMYPNNEQFYQQQNVNNYGVGSIDHHQQQQQQQQQQGVIPSHTRSSPSSNNQQMRQMSMAPATMPLSAYFSSFQSTSPQYPHQEYSLNSTEYCSPQEAPSCAESNSQQLEKEVCVGGTKVIVPNIEEEFSFLFNPRLPHYKEIAFATEDEEQMKNLASANKFYRRNADFLASYRKFLDNNCESVESLADGTPTIAKSWNRNKIYQPPPPPPAIKEKEENVKPTVKEPECSFENDIRYYPLPKSSKERRLSDSSSDDDSDYIWPELTPAATTTTTNKKTTAATASKKDKKEPKETKIRNRESKKDDKETKTVKMKLEKLEKAKQKIEKLKTLNLPPEKLTSKLEKAQAEANAIRESVMMQKKKPTKDSSKDKLETIPRRKLAERKAKDGIINRLHGALDSEDELRSSSDSDPSWTPHDDDDDNLTKRRSIRIRPTKTRTKRKSNEYGSKHKSGHASEMNEKDTNENEMVRSKTKKTSRDSSEQTGHFFMLKTSSSAKNPCLWRLKNDRLQKFEPLEQNGRQQFGSVPVIVKLSEINLTKYQKVDAIFVDKKKDRLIVQLCNKTDVPINTNHLENFMNESSNYENQFHVYTQTLISQALDSNFLNEVVKENDDYFLSNMKIIDDLTTTYVTHLTSVIKWAKSPIETVVKTWPFVSIENTQNDKTENSSAVCAGCHKTNVKQTAVFYGQPYERNTLQGREINSIPDNLDKTMNLCEICARDVKLFNKIWHQKYHAFVECAKYVAKKKSDEKKTKTTDILNDLLADGNWLAKLFYDIRVVWLQVSTVKERAEER